MINADEPAKNQYPILQLYTTLQIWLHQNNQNNAGTYNTNHGQPLPARDYFKLSVGYWPHANLQRAEVKERMINEVEHIDNPKETFFFCWFSEPCLKNNIVLTFIGMARETHDWSDHVALLL